ncbi:hypothetical protein DXG01_000093 [Tephrocybe rancida]|nr:hypothetical protein DXG01_000093 [Tephrocybe rancida]
MASIAHPDVVLADSGDPVLMSEQPKDKANSSPTHSRGASSQEQEQPVDTASVQSVSELNVAQIERPPTSRSTASASLTATRSQPSPSHSPNPQAEDGVLAHQQRRARNRANADNRSTNRLSGFFTNLIHRRDPPTSAPARSALREDTPTATPGPDSETHSRSSSPAPGRPVTPPPPLPAPTLQELGLSLSVVSNDLSPSHFTTPPTSGAFLAPHYLLLCHAQGLDVLSLVSPPAPQPYALVRRVSFKSVVVMEQRGVLVAIAGRRDGVRVYALEEVKKAIEWRIEVEVRRARDRSRRETVKKIVMNSLDTDSRDSAEKTRKSSLSTPPPGGDSMPRNAILRKSSLGSVPLPNHTPPVPLVPRSPTPRTPRKSRTPHIEIPPMPEPNERPPPYSSPSDVSAPPRLQHQTSTVSFNPRSRSGSVNNVLAPVARNVDTSRPHDPDSKADWAESSDDEAIDIVAAAASGSQALDERTSATLSGNVQPLPQASPVISPVQLTQPRPSISSTRRNRPSNLDLSLSRSDTVVPPEPSPAPTLLTLRQALSNSPPTLRTIHTAEIQDPDTPFGLGEDYDADDDDGVSLAQMLLESRIPDLPPAGTRQPQQPILLSSTAVLTAEPDSENPSPRTSEGHNASRPTTSESSRRRRRWSTLLGSSPLDISQVISSSPSATTPTTAPLPRERTPGRFSRSQSFRSNRSQPSTIRPSTSSNDPQTNASSTATLPGTREATPSIISSQSSRSSRFLPRILSNAFNSRRSEERPAMPTMSTIDSDTPRKPPSTPTAPHAPPPKLEYVKLPGTKGALMVKSVETAKKSFLAILCGENGEKVELFAGTYRTALGLSRTFILPDSPRSLELQLQGDDLVEVFLVFSQNVFGLEPATVRVREVRIGRAERRAARRRAREVRAGENASNDSETALADEDTNVNVSIGVSVAVGSTVVATGDGTDTLIPNEHPDAQSDNVTPPDTAITSAIAQSEELVAVATAQMGPYTTFQQLNFAPKFPLASIADEYIIPPTYPAFLEYRAEHEPEEGSVTDLTQIQFSPPGLPVPVPTAPSRWYYRDPKNVIHGPWKASLMQAWYKDGLLPLDLPVRREEDDNYILLKELRLQSVDPTHPFRSPPPPATSSPAEPITTHESERPLLQPISLLSQPRHFGPPALFFSSRGGHSTAIVDARGRSVLKGRFVWSSDEQDEDTKSILMGRMGDIKRLEALDVDDRAVLVAMRQGGLEAVDLSDALLRPADESRTVLPQFAPPASNINRRAPFVWKIGTPVSSSPTTATVLSSKGKGSYNHLSKKSSTGPTKSPAVRSEFSLGDVELDPHDEVLFLGRKDDEIYFCERNAGSFRILRLCPSLA